MDLTKTYPRSVREKLGGVVMLARTADKAKAFANGTIGDYHYNCPMDQAVFKFLAIDHEQFLAKVKIASNDDEIVDFIKLHTDLKEPSEIANFNAEFLQMRPAPGTESEVFFNTLRASIAPERTDITTWSDVLDLDERRVVPLRPVAV
jgi:hypothetical protein